jgi:hypothetical protein
MVQKEGFAYIPPQILGAFTLLWFRPKKVQYLAFPLTGELVAIHLAGMFGWVGMPFVFQVLTRLLIALISMVILGVCMMYVDDVMSVSPIKEREADMDKTDTVITQLLGPLAVAKSKDEFGRQLDFIGWHIDLDGRCVTLARHNLLKTIYVFFSFHDDSPVKLSHIEAMASLASWCSQLCRPMRPYTKALYEAQKLYTTRHTLRHLPALAKVDVCVLRAYLVLSRFKPARIHKPIMSFEPRQPRGIVGFDASLQNVSVGVSRKVIRRGSPTALRQLVAFTSLDLPFPTTTDARRQNTLEFIAGLLGMLIMHMMACAV